MTKRKILINRGEGWRMGPPLNTDIDIHALYRDDVEKEKAWENRHPADAAFKRLLHQVAPLEDLKRARLYEAIQAMPDDPEGVLATCCDGFGSSTDIHADLEEVVLLCAWYKLALERK